EYQNPEQYGEGTNWYRTLIHSAPIQNYSLSISASKDKFNSAIVLGYFRQDGVMYNTLFERYSLRANNDYQINDRLRLGLNIAPTIQLSNNQEIDGQRKLLSAATLASPILSPYDKNGELVLSLNAPNMFPQPNWLRVLKERLDRRKNITVLSNAFAELDIWSGIKYKFQIGLDLGSNNHRDFIPSTAGGDFHVAPPQKATANFNTGFYYTWTAENMLMYSNRFGDHFVDALAGYSTQKYTWEGNTLSGTDFPDDDISWIDAAATKNGGSNMQQWALISYIGRLNYSYKDRYLLQATFRRDGCSRFGMGNKYANFPSVSAGWIISDEAFMEPATNIMNYLKIRASYGLTGNYNIGNYTHLANVGNKNYVFGGSLAPGKAIDNLGNNALTWEETKQLDIGVDFSFLNDRIFVMYDFYQKRTDGMLYQIEIPAASGFWSINSNIGDFKTWGHEITFTSRNLVNDFKWTTNFNMAFNRNKILELSTENAPIGGYDVYGDFNRLEVGHPIGSLFGYVFDGVYMTQVELDSQPKHVSSEIGTARMKDVNNDGKIDANDKTIIGDPTPDVIFGMTNEFSYKNFDLSILLQGQIGGDIMNANYENTENLDGVFNVRKYVADRWRSPENPGNGIVPRTKSGTTELYRYGHSGQVYDASYLAIKNITLGYTIPLKANSYLSRLRFYLSVQQLAVFTKYPGLSPEVSMNGMAWKGLGVDRTAYPVPRTFSIGCNITF
ncbi:MAG: SusC/RagA family TonB-linked outer membrane protein, partial [Prevotella sp.]|nr:SusC/RagA family TonB-linked outer membrane protein [Prevotella sp.]